MIDLKGKENTIDVIDTEQSVPKSPRSAIIKTLAPVLLPPHTTLVVQIGLEAQSTEIAHENNEKMAKDTIGSLRAEQV